VHVAFLGLGQIGGSIARALVADGHTVRAWTPTGSEPRIAGSDGIGWAATFRNAIDGVDLVVLAAPPLACLELIDRLADELPEGDRSGVAVVTDVASTKASIVARARQRHLRFVGGHPMAGRESSGYGHSDPSLFVDRPWVLVPPDPGDAEALELVSMMVAACGAHPVLMDANEHDRAVALISHLPLLVSAALVETAARSADWPAARALSAGGWAGMTRLARGDVRMGSGIFATNAVEVTRQLAALRETLDRWEADLTGSAVDADTGIRLADAKANLTEDPP
jgi:arogenate dehydrogenase (NADP+)